MLCPHFKPNGASGLLSQPTNKAITAATANILFIPLPICIINLPYDSLAGVQIEANKKPAEAGLK
ncbi:hypothetical protein S70_17020 [Providencia stuartii MRSN 2154]|uniref:Uncharacterized protein n=1 Tax=Providencia stuartii (strain MRSN 2154) TaxID=1157951 RepID=A0A140NSN0_PROSM|nr:hypothetical protein S70_17020 [Providencia stuartii MRSN 2154]